jgi:hypothetical protein
MKGIFIATGLLAFAAVGAQAATTVGTGELAFCKTATGSNTLVCDLCAIPATMVMHCKTMLNNKLKNMDANYTTLENVIRNIKCNPRVEPKNCAGYVAWALAPKYQFKDIVKCYNLWVPQQWKITDPDAPPDGWTSDKQSYHTNCPVT